MAKDYVLSDEPRGLVSDLFIETRGLGAARMFSEVLWVLITTAFTTDASCAELDISCSRLVGSTFV